ncbi:putative lipoprotein [Myxococcus xanthus DK 1622]|uniref:Lipoprotein n=3 Tax=Myxococcaceae TaxID=31 RepID=Q1D038_MYXXD|nr:putative lipoprotein [Myxococcus xanthus DK 1622]NOJ53219.1 hypothetical protein [Myxococcus xanthus]QPM78260.1 hypothetical protein I5Q59_28875 [Myxococcus xanthus]QVW67327.1 hypothetical protein JTM82_34225 [Myxococcus xanthus DZ2]UEO06545.1 hypothetical protein K1515_08565 [Myxococcus xanthus DZ2]
MTCQNGRMTPNIRQLVLAGLGTALSACATKPAPPVEHYSLGMSRAEYRDYKKAKADPCASSEPRWLADELTTVNSTMARFLRETEQLSKLDAPDHARQLAMMREATGSLPPIMEVHRYTLNRLKECGFRNTGAFPEIARRGQELLTEVDVRLEEGPKVLAAVALKDARRQWREEMPEREEAARRTWCPPNPQVGQTDLFYARQEVDGRKLWRFCDGHLVEQRAEGEPVLVQPDNLSWRMRRRIKPQSYLDAARAYPTAEMDRQPDSVPSSGQGAAKKSSAPSDGGPG